MSVNMNMKMKTEIGLIRSFNRFYTNILGLVDQHLLKSEFSLSEVRILHEIEKREYCTSKALADMLSMDTGYLSRIIKKFEGLGFINKERSSDDGRAYNLYITNAGRERMTELNNASSGQIATILSPLPEIDRTHLVGNMTTVETLLTNGNNITLENIEIRTETCPGDVGFITFMHGWIYQEEYGYSTAFEGYVAESFYQFLLNFNAEKDRLWCAEHNGNIVGCIGIVGHGERAQLRWFLTDPHYRNIGLGKKLLNEAISFARKAQYSAIFLDTTEDLDKAISLYQKIGFVKISQKPNDNWRKGLVETRMEMILQ